MSLVNFLPEPTQLSQDQLEAEESLQAKKSYSTAPVSACREPRPYGHGKGWVPRPLKNFGDGGAFPEIHVAQFPQEMRRKKKTSNALAVQVDAEGKIKYGAIARQGQSKDKVVFSKYTDPLPKEVLHCYYNIAERKAREAVEMRAQVEKKMAQNEKEKKEEKLWEMAQMTRDHRAGIKSPGDKVGKDGEARDRDEIRHDRRKERQQDRNISRACPYKTSKLQREQDRDISKVITPGVPNPRSASEAQYDQRLFMEDEDGPVQFEEDPFGLDKFFEEVNQYCRSKRPSSSSSIQDRKRRKCR